MTPMDTMQVFGRHYRPRVLDAGLQFGLKAAGAVLIEGARASGKTMTALNAASSYSFMDDDRVQQALEISPDSVLAGEAPKLLDEWQTAPAVWNRVRRAVDFSNEQGRFILTGSAVPADDVIRHTGAGRLLRLRQRTMSLWEKSDDPQSTVSLRSLFDGEYVESNLDSSASIDDVITDVLQPGFPAIFDLEPSVTRARLRSYIDDVSRTDIVRLAEIRHSPELIKSLIASVARGISTSPKLNTIAQDVRSQAPNIAVETVSSYIGLLQRLFVIEAQPAWAPSLRSRARLRTSPVLHLVDPSVAAIALGAGYERLLSDFETLGLLFESAVVHDLMVFASALQGEVYHYRDSNGREIDAVVTLPDGRWGAVEIKLGAGQIDKGTDSLRRAVSDIDTGAVGEPAFRMVVTGNGPTLTSEDGIVVTSHRALCP